MPPLELYPFRYRDPLTGKWVRARYVAELHEIARYVEWEIVRPARDPIAWLFRLVQSVSQRAERPFSVART
jgi:hypothetical protein